MKRIADIRSADRPGEKLKSKGVKALSDIELLAILIGMGNVKHDVMTLALKVLKCIEKNGGIPDFEQLQNIEGIGLAKASLITAAIEFSRRRIRPEGTKVRFVADLLPLPHNYADRKQEHQLCVSLNGAQEVIAIRVVTIGLADKTMIHPREVYTNRPGYFDNFSTQSPQWFTGTKPGSSIYDEKDCCCRYDAGN